MKIAILSTISGYCWGGTEEVWFGVAERALDAGHSILLAADHLVADSEQAQELCEKGMLVSSRRIQTSRRIHRLLAKIRPDHVELDRFEPDVLLVNAGSPYDFHYNPLLAAVIARQRCRKVFFCHFNSDRLVRESGGPGDAVLESSDHFVFVSEANRKQLEVQLARSISNATVLLNRSRLELESPLPFPQTETAIFANVARLETRWKGQDLLPQIFSEEKWRNRGAKVRCYGVGPEKDYLEKLIGLYRTEDAVSLQGYSRDLESIWGSCHALLLPSRGEGTPLVAVEAMMCGRPVIATDVGGNAEVIEDGVTGFIAEAPTERSFGAAMERAWEARDQWAEMGRRAHERAKDLADSDPTGRLIELLTRKE